MAYDDIGSRRRVSRTLVVGLLALALLLVLGWVLVLGLGNGRSDGAAPQVPPPSSSAAVSEISWVEYQGVSLPVSRQAGPTSTADGRAIGFARSDLGTALAAAHLVIRAGPGPGPDVYEPTIAEQVVGPDRSALAATVERDYEAARTQSGIESGEPLGAGNVTLLGYRIPVSSDSMRQVTLVERAPDANGVPQYFEVAVAVQWVDGDWRLVAPREGSWTTAITQLDQEPASYTRFERAD